MFLVLYYSISSLNRRHCNKLAKFSPFKRKFYSRITSCAAKKIFKIKQTCENISRAKIRNTGKSGIHPTQNIHRQHINDLLTHYYLSRHSQYRPNETPQVETLLEMASTVIGDQIWRARYYRSFLLPITFPSPLPSASKHTLEDALVRNSL